MIIPFFPNKMERLRNMGHWLIIYTCVLSPSSPPTTLPASPYHDPPPPPSPNQSTLAIYPATKDVNIDGKQTYFLKRTHHSRGKRLPSHIWILRNYSLASTLIWYQQDKISTLPSLYLSFRLLQGCSRSTSWENWWSINDRFWCAFKVDYFDKKGGDKGQKS